MSTSSPGRLEIAIYLLSLLFFPAFLMWNGYVVAALWQWFCVPTFGLPPLSMPATMGIWLLPTYLTRPFPAAQPEEHIADYLVRVTERNVIKPFAAYSIGWVLQHWM